MFRWTDGVVASADDCWYDDAVGWGRSNATLRPFRSTSIFWSNNWTQYLYAEFDVTTSSMAAAEFPFNRWHSLQFDHDGTISRLGTYYHHQYLAGSHASWIDPLGLSNHINPELNAWTSLAGNLATVIGLMAFSCGADELEHVLPNAWRDRQWVAHGRSHGSKQRRL